MCDQRADRCRAVCPCDPRGLRYPVLGVDSARSGSPDTAGYAWPPAEAFVTKRLSGRLLECCGIPLRRISWAELVTSRGRPPELSIGWGRSVTQTVAVALSTYQLLAILLVLAALIGFVLVLIRFSRRGSEGPQ
jgi:hypothetical protein